MYSPVGVCVCACVHVCVCVCVCVCVRARARSRARTCSSVSEYLSTFHLISPNIHSLLLLKGSNRMCAINTQLTTCTVTPSPAEEGDQVIIVCEFPSDYSGQIFNVHLYKTTVDRSGQVSKSQYGCSLWISSCL